MSYLAAFLGGGTRAKLQCDWLAGANPRLDGCILGVRVGDEAL